MAVKPEILAPQLFLVEMETVAPQGVVDPDFLSMYGALRALRSDDFPVDAAIISATDAEAIEGRFDTWGVLVPEIIVPNTDIGTQNPGLELIHEIRDVWEGLRPGALVVNMLYASRHRHDEGWLAEESGARFVHIPDDTPILGWSQALGILEDGPMISQEHVDAAE